MDAPALGVAHGITGAVDVGVDGAREPGDGRVLDALGDGGHGLEIALGGDGKARLDDVDAHGIEAVGDLELLLEGHGRAGALLAVAQRGVEDDGHGLGGCGLSRALSTVRVWCSSVPSLSLEPASRGSWR